MEPFPSHPPAAAMLNSPPRTRWIEPLLRDAQRMQAVNQSLKGLTAVQKATLMAMSSLAQMHDFETGNHIRRTQHYVRILASKLLKHRRFSVFLTKRNRGLLFSCAPLHDIGKAGISDRILRKPGRLTAAEMAVTKTHASLGRDIIAYAEQQMGGPLDFFALAKEIAYSHHEKWNGSGYPQGLRGDAIPISARLMAVADMYDAIVSRRIYQLGISHTEAVEIVVEGSGSHFDPDVIDAFLKARDEFQAVAATYSDSDGDIREEHRYVNRLTAGEPLHSMP